MDNKILFFVIFIMLMYMMKKQNNLEKQIAKEGMTNTQQADLDAIKTLAEVAKKLQEGGYTNAGDLTVLGNTKAAGIHFTKAWSGKPDADANVAEIASDTGTFKKLMIVGNKSNGGSRQVGIWDDLVVSANLQTNNNSTVHGALTVNNGSHLKATGSGGALALYSGSDEPPYISFMPQSGGRNTYLMGRKDQLFTPSGFEIGGVLNVGGNLTVSNRNVIAEIDDLKGYINKLKGHLWFNENNRLHINMQNAAVIRANGSWMNMHWGDNAMRAFS